MNAKILIILLFTFVSSLTHAVKVYKIVDENGNVTFSQVPPGSNSQPASGKVEEMKLSTGGMSAIRTELDYQYCGEIQLPMRSQKYRNSAKHHANNIVYSQKNWQQEMSRIESKIQRDNNAQINSSLRNTNSTYQKQTDLRYQQQRQRDAERLRDLRCAINWAENRQDLIEESQQENSKERARLVGISTKLEQSLQNKCGDEPDFDPSDPTNEASRKRWYQCGKEIMRDLRKVRARISRL